MQEFSMEGGYMKNPKKNTKLSKLGCGRLPGTIQYHVLFPIGQPPYSDTRKVHITQI